MYRPMVVQGENGGMMSPIKEEEDSPLHMVDYQMEDISNPRERPLIVG